MARHAMILFAHGARDPRWAAPFERLKAILQQQSPDSLVGLAYLELMTPSLPDQVQQLVQAGATELTVVPIFLGQGGHVLRDLPLIVEKVQESHPELTVRLAKAVGEDADVLHAIAAYCMRVTAGE